MVDRARLRALQAQLAELNRIKQKVQNEISRTIGHIENLALRDIPTKIITKVNKQVNAEGYMERIIKNRFKAEARYGPGSTKWRQLTPEYAARKAAAGYGNRILFRTGALYFATLQAVPWLLRWVARRPQGWPPTRPSRGRRCGCPRCGGIAGDATRCIPTRSRATRHRMPTLRLPPLPRDLHARRLGWADRAPAGMPPLWTAYHHLRTRRPLKIVRTRLPVDLASCPVRSSPTARARAAYVTRSGMV